MFSILGGYPPFWAEEDSETYQKILAGDPGYVQEYWVPVSNEAKDLLRRLFTIDPAKRPTATQVFFIYFFLFFFLFSFFFFLFSFFFFLFSFFFFLFSFLSFFLSHLSFSPNRL